MTTATTDTFDVTPKEYATWSKVTEATARKMFASWFEQKKEFIMRVGVSTERYPDGKNLFMSRAHFTMLQQRSTASANIIGDVRRN